MTSTHHKNGGKSMINDEDEFEFDFEEDWDDGI